MASASVACQNWAIATTSEPAVGASPTESVDRPVLGASQRPFRRSVETAIVGGVVGGLSVRLGIRPRWLRAVALVSILLGGTGLIVYVAAWVFVPRRGESISIAQRVVNDRRESQIVLASSTILAAVLVTLLVVGHQGVSSAGWPVLVTAVGLLVVWRGSSPAERIDLQAHLARLPFSDTGSRPWRSVLSRLVGGVALLGVGVAALSPRGLQSTNGALLGVGAMVGGFLLIFAPWWVRTLRELTNERRERLRAQTRADFAARVHDSVLQTLALIQKSAEDPAAVIRLARQQERDLRTWLFDEPRVAGATTFSSLVDQLARDVEEHYDITVDVVVVGDIAADDDVDALVAAGREAAVNAAKWSGAASVSVYGEVETDRVSLFVRDAGRGFVLDAVAADRRGIAHSIQERLRSHGGTAVIRSAPGSGTDVELVLGRRTIP